MTPSAQPPVPHGPPGDVLIVDDHELIGTSLTLALRAEGLAAHGRGAGGPDAIVAAAARRRPGVVLLDLDLGRDPAGRPVDGVDLVDPLRAGGWRVVVLSGTADRTRVGAALDEGAVAAVPKHAPMPVLLRAVRAALAGREVMPAEHRDRLIAAFRQRRAERGAVAAKLELLTAREREVLALLADGHRAQAVADRFVVSLATVRTQIRAVLTKLGVSSQLEAVALLRSATER